MKEFDESEAIAAMMEKLCADRRDEDAVYEILDRSTTTTKATATSI